MSFRQAFAAHRRLLPAVACLSVAFAPHAASADSFIDDPNGDFVSSYVGPRSGSLDIEFAYAALEDGDLLHLVSRMDGIVGSGSDDPLYIWGVDRGSSAFNMTNPNFPAGAGIAFDALVVFRGDGITEAVTGMVTTFGAGGVQTTVIDRSFAFWETIGGFVPLDLLPSTGFAAADYKLNFWTQDGAGLRHVADFALDNAMFAVNDERTTAVPEPATWALMIGGFSLAGASLRHRRSALARS